MLDRRTKGNPDSAIFTIALHQLRQRGFMLHSVYPPLKRGHCYRKTQEGLEGQEGIIPLVICQRSADSVFVYKFSNGRGAHLMLKFILRWQASFVRKCYVTCASCEDGDSAIQHHPQFASNPLLYRETTKTCWDGFVNITDIPSRPFHVRARPFEGGPKGYKPGYRSPIWDYAVQDVDGLAGEDRTVSFAKDRAIFAEGGRIYNSRSEAPSIYQQASQGVVL